MPNIRSLLSTLLLSVGVGVCGVFADEAPAGSAAVESAGATQTATFSMYCYWTGEATVGKIDGVLASRIGHWSGREIVQVDYDPSKTDVASLAGALRRQKSLYAVVIGKGDASPSEVGGADVDELSGKPHFIEPKHSLRTRYPRLAALDLTEAQAIALNSWSYFGGSMPDVLTTEQKERLRAER